MMARKQSLNKGHPIEKTKLFCYVTKNYKAFQDLKKPSAVDIITIQKVRTFHFEEKSR